MLRYFCLSLISLSLWSSAFAGDDKKEVLTLSKGKYVETFDQDSIEVIGNILFNVNSRTIVGFIDEKEEKGENAMPPEIISRWLSIDPLAAKYPSMSPYIFCGDNPIVFKDPNGAELRFFGHEEDMEGFKTAINVASQGQIIMNINAKGFTTLSIAEGQTLTEKNQAFYDAMNIIIGDKSSTIIMVQGDAGDNRGSAYLGGYENVTLPGLDYNVGSLDYVDMQETETATNGQLSVLGFVTHEAWENYDKQILNPDASFKDSHDAAIQKQENVDGVKDLSLKGDVSVDGKNKTVNGKVNISYKTANGAQQDYKVDVQKGNPASITKTN
jgi:hypothetical protein